MMDGLLGKMVRWFEYLSGEVAIVLLLPLVLFFFVFGDYCPVDFTKPGKWVNL